MAAAHGGPVAARRILITVGERADESAAVFRWAAAHFLEARDELTLLHVHTGGVLSLVRGAFYATPSSYSRSASV